jgi:hypothetical protein
MKSFIIAVSLLFVTAACSAEKPAEPAKPVATVTAEKEQPRTKRVCKDVVKDGKTVKNKDGSVKQDCRTIKIHKKHEGTKVPPK